jgi:hypothetical protein
VNGIARGYLGVPITPTPKTVLADNTGDIVSIVRQKRMEDGVLDQSESIGTLRSP